MIQGSTAATVEQQRNSTDNSSDVQCTASEARRISPLAILMEEMEQMPMRGPEGTTTEITIDTIENGDWLVVVYDEHWWLVKAIAVTLSIKMSKWKFLHPHGPTAHFHPKPGRKDVCFCFCRYSCKAPWKGIPSTIKPHKGTLQHDP
ncbi:hypothetical protein AAFF_G00218910 [Aldrovandia affinis]|uniref:Uncharacterized protein n=1 Tax=Aldrovandia affinis TaxID=143900 RepID=A0AAD7SW07_9TELE|nr:hypothetical protein AAFF_G00218910 [Aldrovandia affinis]